MKKYILLLFMFVPLSLIGQTSDYKINIPNITLKSPEVQGIEKYGNIPINEYTGTPSIDIPLYTIKDGSVEFPISLNYHATGIQVTQEATWVGLGWNLLAGGCISRIPVGSIDGVISTFDYKNDWEKIMVYKPDGKYFSEGYPRRFNERTWNLWSCISQDTSAINDNLLRNSFIGSGERDVYAANFMGHSFKFSLHPVDNHIVFLGEKNKCRIENSNGNWIITDELGVKYYFESYEISDVVTQNYNQSYISTWYLSRIEAQGCTIKISYQSVSGVELLPAVSETSSYGYPVDYQDLGLLYRTSDCNRLRQQLYISTIETNTQLIKFITKSRLDLRKGLALDEMIVYAKNSQNVVEHYKFNYDYFIGCQKGTNVMTEDYITKRLKLINIYKSDGTNKIDKYNFEYNETLPLPYKTSFSQDYWGYYNGEENKIGSNVLLRPSSSIYSSLYPLDRSLVPGLFELFLGDSIGLRRLQTEIGGNLIKKSSVQRAASKTYITAGMLKSITYPTGGKTVFEFEPHTFANSKYPCIEDINNLTFPSAKIVKYQVLSNNNDASHKLNSVKINLDRNAVAKVYATFRSTEYSFYDMQPSFVRLTGYIEGTVGPRTLQMQSSLFCPGNPECDMFKFEKSNTVTISQTFKLSKGSYLFEANIASGIPNQGYNFNTAAEGNIEIQLESDTVIYNQAKKMNSYGGGVRIKQVTNYSDENIASIKRYCYEKTDGSSSGLLIYPLKFYSNKLIQEGRKEGASDLVYTRYNHSIHTLSSSNKFSYSPHANNTTVGYSRVEVESISPSSSLNNGKAIKEFINVPGSFYSDFMFTDKSTQQYNNGKASRIINLNNKKDTLYVEKNNYVVDNFESNYINTNVTDLYIGPTDICGINNSQNPLAYNGRFDIIVYPTNNYTTYLVNKEETQFLLKNKVIKNTSFEYDPANYKIKKMSENLYKVCKTTEFKYASSFLNTGNIIYKTMIDKNMLAQTVEESTSFGGTLIFNKKTDYGMWESIIAPKSILTKSSKLSEESRLEYLEYDVSENPLYITKDGITKLVYIWGYGGQYPIAEIKNATYSQLTDVLNRNTLKSISDKLEPSDSDWALISSLQNNINLKNAHVTIFKYKPLVGILEIIDPKGISTYYGYDSFNRLNEVYIKSGSVKKVIHAYDYNYVNK